MRGVRRIATALTAMVIVLAGVLSAAPASAATSAIEFSRDAVSWSPALSGSLFGDAPLVPASAVTRSFYIRNNAPGAGYLRLTLRDVTTDNLDLAGALSLRADLVGWPGEATAVASARPCARLSEGPVLPSGGVARVDLSTLLGDLDGLRGQDGHVQFQIVVSLSGEPLGLGVSGCPTSGVSVAGFSGPTSFRGGSYVYGSAAHFYASTSYGWLPAVNVPGTGIVPLDPTTDTPVAATPTHDGIRVAVNTGRFYQEYDAALWLIAALLGAAAARVIPRRRTTVQRTTTQSTTTEHTGNDQNGALR